MVIQGFPAPVDCKPKLNLKPPVLCDAVEVPVGPEEDLTIGNGGRRIQWA